MPRKQMLHVVGITDDNRKVIGGVHRFVSTTGVPLTYVLDELVKADLVLAWDHYYADAVNTGTNPGTVLMHIDHAMQDVYGKELAQEYKDKMEGFIYAEPHDT